MINQCYDCGKAISKEETTREHIPAQNLFSGYSDSFKLNRLTVPACRSCNEMYSKIDQEIRDAVGIMNEQDDNQSEITRKAVKSILRRKNWSGRTVIINGKVVGVKFDYETFKKLHIKNFNGIFFNKYGYALPEDYKVIVISESDESNPKLSSFGEVVKNHLNQSVEEEISGHEKIFKYKIKALKTNHDGSFQDTSQLDESIGVVATMIYHEQLNSTIIALKKEFLDKIGAKL